MSTIASNMQQKQGGCSNYGRFQQKKEPARDERHNNDQHPHREEDNADGVLTVSNNHRGNSSNSNRNSNSRKMRTSSKGSEIDRSMSSSRFLRRRCRQEDGKNQNPTYDLCCRPETGRGIRTNDPRLAYRRGTGQVLPFPPQQRRRHRHQQQQKPQQREQEQQHPPPPPPQPQQEEDQRRLRQQEQGLIQKHEDKSIWDDYDDDDDADDDGKHSSRSRSRYSSSKQQDHQQHQQQQQFHSQQEQRFLKISRRVRFSLSTCFVVMIMMIMITGSISFFSSSSSSSSSSSNAVVVVSAFTVTGPSRTTIFPSKNRFQYHDNHRLFVHDNGCVLKPTTATATATTATAAATALFMSSHDNYDDGIQRPLQHREDGPRTWVQKRISGKRGSSNVGSSSSSSSSLWNNNNNDVVVVPRVVSNQPATGVPNNRRTTATYDVGRQQSKQQPQPQPQPTIIQTTLSEQTRQQQRQQQQRQQQQRTATDMNGRRQESSIFPRSIIDGGANGDRNNSNRRRDSGGSAGIDTMTGGTGGSRRSSSVGSTARHGENAAKQPRRQKLDALPVTGYDAKAIEEFYDARPLQVGWRLNSLSFPLLGWYMGLLLDKSLGIDEDEAVQRKRGEELRNLLIQSRSVALIKSGQALSLRPDIIRNPIWAEELGKLVDAVGAFSDVEAMRIMRRELDDLSPKLQATKKVLFSPSTKSSSPKTVAKTSKYMKLKSKSKLRKAKNRAEKLVASDEILSLFDFDNDNMAVASASIGQVYKARIRPGAKLEAAIGREAAQRWGGKIVAIKVQRPDVEASASLDMYLLRKTAMWLSKMRSGDLTEVADAFGMQLFGELDYIREANNCERFKALYGHWTDVKVPSTCAELTRRRVLVMEWVDGEKGPWPGQEGIEMVRIGLRCSVDQLMTTGLFHSDPHRGNLLRTPDGKLAFIDFGMMADIDEADRYGLFGLAIGLQNKDLSLITENLVNLGFLKDTAQLDQLVPRLRQALMNSTGGSGKASDVNFARLQAELDAISRENILRFSTPPFFTVIIRSLTILEGVALSVDRNFRLVRGSYPYVLKQLLSPDDDAPLPDALEKLLIRILTVNGEQKEIEWQRLRDLLVLAQKASKSYDPRKDDANADDKVNISRKTIVLLVKFLTSRAGVFMKKPLVHELAEAIDAMASMSEANISRLFGGFLPMLPGMNGPVNTKRLDEISIVVDTFRDALLMNQDSNTDGQNGQARMDAITQIFREIADLLRDERFRQDSTPLIEELRSVVQMVAVEVLEIRGSRAVRSLLRVADDDSSSSSNNPGTLSAAR